MRSPEEFERIREENRWSMGLAGYEGQRINAVPLGRQGLGDGILGAALGAAGPVRVASAFPPFSYEWDPSAPSPPPQPGGLGQWITEHVIRPEFEYAGLRYAPGEGKADYSGIALAGTVAVGLGLLGTLTWLVYRAFSNGRRSNPRRLRYETTRYYVVSGRRAA